MSRKKSNPAVWIPRVPKSHIVELSSRIRPVITFGRNEHWYVVPVDTFTQSFLWDPEKESRAQGLKVLCDIKTYHTFGYYCLFRPTVAEVIAQIPRAYIKDTVAFEIVGRPMTATDLNKDVAALNAGYHGATTRLYGSIAR